VKSNLKCKYLDFPFRGCDFAPSNSRPR
jgi:hypothetical protein